MDRELVEKFVEVTGESEVVAAQYLALADGNVETAISLMFEGGGEENTVANSEPPVRAPISPTQEVLVPTDTVCGFPRSSNNVFDRFRDFAVETQRQEEEMTHRVTGAKKFFQRKSKRLEDLFRPPCDILFLGNFMAAREHAKQVNRWLLVNVQNPQEFACQILNRDLWPNPQIREIVKDHFVLWQVLSNTADGKRYIDFYNVNEYPYLAVVDPRTGECMTTYNHITVDSLAAGLNDMLSTHASPESAPQESSSSKEWTSSFSAKRQSPDSVVSDSSSCFKKSKNSEDSGNSENILGACSTSTSNLPCSSSSSSNINIISKRSRIDELDSKSRRLDCNFVNETSKSNQNEVSQSSTCEKTMELRNDEPLLRLCLRLPHGGKETVSMSANDTMETFLRRMEEMGYPPSEHTYLIPFPKTDVGALPPTLRLLDTILYPSNTVFITKI
ncbi:UBX domain-containing protein 7 isoform X2 [Orussus abietinus]|uniref:UBX domain-containing protein 7 isoform X2 n=1 Tax=Orussus abietinus TaxID=222816 RepID=UPI000625A33C|nr:UBX domain-containing protein 7 isoform X2 [Orussus abietinus]